MNSPDDRSPAPSRPWVRDFVLVGACCGGLAPLLVLPWMHLPALGYAAGTSAAGALAGVAAGRAGAWLAGRSTRWGLAQRVAAGALLGALWGLATGVAAALVGLVPQPRHLLGLSLVATSLGGALQLGWFWPVYAAMRRQRRDPGRAVAAACLTGPALGWAVLATAWGTIIVLDTLWRALR